MRNPDLDRVLDELTEMTEELSATDLEPVEVVDEEPAYELDEPTRIRNRGAFNEPTVRVDMPWIRAQLW
jgi:hypothetical protein